jgi:uncharacterized protein YbbC (DUF1343 family)
MIRNVYEVLCGADVVARDGIRVSGKCGLITNHTGVLKDMTPTALALQKLCDLVALFAPEHGLMGQAQAGADTGTCTIDPKTGLPVYNLYGKGQAEAERALEDLDTVFFDIQDVGARFYTYAYTMTDTMKICAEKGIRFIVLDRPNPLGGRVTEGTILDRRFSSFVGRFPTATRLGLTIGEFARMMNDTERIGCDLAVIPCAGWTREMYFDDTNLVFVAPSPNIPTVDSAFSYIGTCIFEGTNVSEGRGTTQPFEVIGAPWMNAEKVLTILGKQEGVLFRETAFVPTFSKYAGELCHGIRLHITDRDAYSPFAVGLKLLDAIRKTNEELEISKNIVGLLGTDEIFLPDFEVAHFIEKEAEKVTLWQRKSTEWYLY